MRLGSLPSLETLTIEQKQLLDQIQPYLTEFKSRILNTYKLLAKANAEVELKKFKIDSIKKLHENELTINLPKFNYMWANTGLNVNHQFGLDYVGGRYSSPNFNFEEAYQSAIASTDKAYPLRATDTTQAMRYESAIKRINAYYFLDKILDSTRGQFVLASKEYKDAINKRSSLESEMSKLKDEYDHFMGPYKAVLSDYTFDNLLDAARKEDQIIPQADTSTMTIPDESLTTDQTKKKSALPWVIAAGVLARILVR